MRNTCEQAWPRVWDFRCEGCGAKGRQGEGRGARGAGRGHGKARAVWAVPMVLGQERGAQGSWEREDKGR